QVQVSGLVARLLAARVFDDEVRPAAVEPHHFAFDQLLEAERLAPVKIAIERLGLQNAGVQLGLEAVAAAPLVARKLERALEVLPGDAKALRAEAVVEPLGQERVAHPL